MKQARQAIARWTAKVLAPTKNVPPKTIRQELRPIDADQLRQVAGGVADSPKGNW